MSEKYKPIATPGERIKEALVLRNMKASVLAEQSGLDKSSISCYLSGRYEPKQEALYRMGVVLDVAEMWLAGYDIPRDRPAVQKKNDKLAELVGKMRRDDKLFSFYSKVSELPEEQRSIYYEMSELPEEQLAIIGKIIAGFRK